MMFLEISYIAFCILCQQLGAVLQPIEERHPPILMNSRQPLISDYIESVKLKCNISYADVVGLFCNRPVTRYSNSPYFDYEQAICVTLYDSIQRICSQRNDKMLQLGASDQNIGDKNVLCNNLKRALNVSILTKDSVTGEWIRALIDKLNTNDDIACTRTCIQTTGQNITLNPICSAVMQASHRLKTMMSEDPSEKKSTKKTEAPANLPNLPGKKPEVKKVDLQKASGDSVLFPLDQTYDDAQEESNVYAPMQSEGEPPVDVPPKDFNLGDTGKINENSHNSPLVTEKINQDPHNTHADVEIETPLSKTIKNEIKKVNSVTVVEPKVQEEKTSVKIDEKTSVAETHQEIPKDKVKPEHEKEVVKSESPEKAPSLPLHNTVQVPQNSNPVIKTPVNTKENKESQATPVVQNSQEVPAKNNVDSLSPPVEIAKPENVEKSTDDTSKKIIGSKPEKTTADQSQTQNIGPNDMPEEENNDDNVSVEGDDLNSIGDQGEGPDIQDEGLETGNGKDMTYRPNDASLKDDNPIPEDDDSEIPVNSAADKSSVVYGRDKFVNAEDSHFFAYFMTMVILCILGYLVFHNKQKILALALEGRSRRSTRRRPNTSGYRKLDSNLEEAVTSTCSTSVTHVIY